MPNRYRDVPGGRSRTVSAPDAQVEPGIDPTENPNGPVVFTFEVDGERFAVTSRGAGDWGYEWLTGPNPGYGFGVSGPPMDDPDEHRERVRAFLRDIDPATGY